MNLKKFVAALLVFVMAIATIPFSAFAAGANGSEAEQSKLVRAAEDYIFELTDTLEADKEYMIVSSNAAGDAFALSTYSYSDTTAAAITIMNDGSKTYIPADGVEDALVWTAEEYASSSGYSTSISIILRGNASGRYLGELSNVPHTWGGSYSAETFEYDGSKLIMKPSYPKYLNFSNGSFVFVGEDDSAESYLFVKTAVGIEADPTAAPTNAPTAEPTAVPTVVPTTDPTVAPTEPTDEYVFQLATGIEEGNEYVIVNTNAAGNAYALSTTSSNDDTTKAAVTLLSNNGMIYINASDVADALVWTCEVSSSNTYLKSNATGRYMGASSTGISTWSTVGSADKVSYDGEHITLTYSYYTSKYIAEGENSFVASSTEANAYMLVKTEASYVEPTTAPTEAPTAVPTEVPTAVPTTAPTAVPTEVPTAAPTAAPAPIGEDVFQLASTLEAGKEYMIVSTNVAGNAYALSITSSSDTMNTAITLANDGSLIYINASDVADALVWTAEEYEYSSGYSTSTAIVLKNNENNRYLGSSSTKPYLWGNISTASSISYDGSHVVLNVSSYSTKYLTVGESNFVLTDAEAPAYLFVKTVSEGVEPTAVPTAEPTVAPTTAPTTEPTVAPTTAPTAEPTVVPTAAPTSVPGGVIGTPSVSAQIVNGHPVITWTAADNAVSYYVYRAAKGGSYVRIATVNGLSYTDTDSLTVGAKYYYKVCGVDASGKSGNLSSYADVVMSNASISLTAPTISANVVNGKPVITWNAVNGAASYEVLRAAKGGSYVVVGTCTTTSYTDNDSLTNGAKYYYKVRAVSATGIEGPLSTYALITAASDSASLSAPVISATIVDGKPVISWNAVNGAESYAILRAPKGGSYALVGTATGTSFTDNSVLTAGAQYYYKVRAISSVGAEGPLSTYVMVIAPASAGSELAAPANVKAIVSGGSPVISWNAVSGAAKYEIYRAIKGGSYTMIGTSATTSYTDASGLNAGAKYYYKVRAIDANGNAGAMSSYAYIIAPTASIAVPNLTAVINGGIPVLNWNAISGAVKYEIVRAPKGGSYVLAGTVTGTSFSDTASLNAGVRYFYKVRAVDANNNASDYSAYAGVTIPAKSISNLVNTVK